MSVLEPLGTRVAVCDLAHAGFPAVRVSSYRRHALGRLGRCRPSGQHKVSGQADTCWAEVSGRRRHSGQCRLGRYPPGWLQVSGLCGRCLWSWCLHASGHTVGLMTRRSAYLPQGLAATHPTGSASRPMPCLKASQPRIRLEPLHCCLRNLAPFTEFEAIFAALRSDQPCDSEHVSPHMFRDSSQ